jgi:ABC-2 type transport system ATP-binding protein
MKQAEYAVRVSRVTAQFGRYLALDNVSADLPQGRIVGMIGPSGAGKTTLMRAIVGRKRIRSGTIDVLGELAGAKSLRTRVSYMTQDISVYSDLTVRENLRYFATMLGMKRREISYHVDELLDIVDMGSHQKQLVRNLSGGQKQRVSLAVALIGFPPLMVLDEPTVGLDPVLRDELWKLFRKLADDGHTLIVSSHVMDEAERCDELLLLRDGHILAQGSPDELRTRTHTHSVEASFLKLVGGAA